MRIDQLLDILNPFTNDNQHFILNLVEMNNDNGNVYYKNSINKNVNQNYGVYVVCNKMNNEILYIGKAGTIKNDGSFKDQNLNGRLLASRGNKYSSSYKYFKHKMNQHNIEIIEIYAIYTNMNNPPAFIEAFSINHFFNLNKRLPLLNDEF
jgi:hypothetical protein